MVSTRRNRKIKTPSLKRKQRRTRRNQRKLKGGTLTKCIKECTDRCYDEWEWKGIPTKIRPTNNGWYIIHDETTMYGFTYPMNSLHNNADPTKSVSVLIIPKRGGSTIDLLDEFKNRDFDLPILGYISRGGYALSIDQNRLVWKRGDTIIPYVHGEEPDQ